MREGLGIMIVEGYIANNSSYLRQLIQIVTGIPIMDMAVYVFGIISAVSILMGMASPSRKMTFMTVLRIHILLVWQIRKSNFLDVGKHLVNSLSIAVIK